MSLFLPNGVTHSLAGRRAAGNTIIVATLECFSLEQVVRVAKNPMMQDGETCGGLVLRKATFEEYRKHCPSADAPHNRDLLKNANFYEVAVD
jgi:hypothetical protein